MCIFLKNNGNARKIREKERITGRKTQTAREPPDAEDAALGILHMGVVYKQTGGFLEKKQPLPGQGPLERAFCMGMHEEMEKEKRDDRKNFVKMPRSKAEELGILVKVPKRQNRW